VGNENDYRLTQEIPGTFAEYQEEQAAKNARIKALLEALQAVEWVDEEDPFGPWCPWCGNYKRSGHDGKCRRQDAIALAKGGQ